MRDFDIRLAMKETALSEFYTNNSIVVEELTLPCTNCRIDIAVVNGSLHGYEIKSAQDTLARLRNQIEGYSKVFDYLSIFTEEKHSEKILSSTPNWINVSCFVEAEEGPIVKVLRQGTRNSNRNGFFIAKLLRKEELLDLVRVLEIPYKKSLRAWTLCEILAEAINVDDLSEMVRQKLKSRLDWKLHSKAGLRFL